MCFRNYIFNFLTFGSVTTRHAALYIVSQSKIFVKFTTGQAKLFFDF